MAKKNDRKQKIDAKPTVSNELVHVLAAFLEKQGVDYKQVWAPPGGNADFWSEKDGRISAERFLQIWNQAEAAAGDDNFGLNFGQDLAGNYLRGNILVSMMANCATIGDAVQIFCKYHLLMEDAILPKMAKDSNTVHLWWEFFVPGIKIPRQHSESLLSAVTEILRTVSGKGVNPEEITFCHSSPNDLTAHQAIFETRLLFDQPVNGLKISRKDFDRPIFLACRNLFEALEPLAQKRLRQMAAPDSWSDKVSREIYLLLASGKVPDVETVSANMALSARSLQMKLQKEGSTFKQLFDRLRKKSAMAYLKEPDMSICEIALLLGFSEQSAFNHAFKRWTGISPGQFKKGI